MTKADNSDKQLSILSQSKCIIKYTHDSNITFLTRVRYFIDSMLMSDSHSFLVFATFLIGIFLVVLFPQIAVRFILSLLIVVGILLFASCKLGSTKIQANVEGIKLPPHFHKDMNGKLSRGWNELNLIMFARAGRSSEDPEQILLGFTDNCTAEFNIDGFTKDNLEELLLTINSYNPNVNQVPDAAMNRLKIDDTSMGQSALSFTGLWKEELSSRFGATVFVPLDPGDELNGGAIKILGQIAFGGLSAIYIAQSESFGVVIVKEAVVPVTMDDQVAEKSLELFQRESQLLSKIEHPRIAKVFDYFVENGRHYMLLEYIEGRNLRTFIHQEGPQSELIVKDWAQQLAKILEYLHRLEPPIIHRDLTPSNLILEKDGGITLIDFGAANLFIGTATGTIVGKSAYIPMEQFKGKANPSSDIYALGSCLYYALTGKDPDPFSQSSPISSGIEISETFDSLIQSCTKVNFEGRVQDAPTLIKELEQIV